MSMLSLRNIFKTYEQIPILQNVSLQVGRGEILGLLGESGSGKSTLLRIAAGLLDADQGTVLLGRKPISPARDQIGRAHV